MLKRIQNCQISIQERGCETFLITNPKDILYLTGLSLSQGRILITQKEAFLIVDGRYFENCAQKSPIPVVLADKDCLWELMRNAKTLGVDSEAISYQFYIDFEKECTDRNISLRPKKGVLQLLRARKDSEEIAKLKAAAELGSQGFDFLLSQLKSGITEEELAELLGQFWKKKGASGFSFPPIIAFGKPSSMPHYRAGKNQLKTGDLILIDIGVELNEYHSDMTRVVFFGEVDPELKKIHAIVYKAMQKALTLCRPGITVSDLDKAAREVIAGDGYGENFSHSLGHGVGLDIHEFPTVKDDPTMDVTLEEGMVITIEPGIYLPDVGGVRLEDTIVITQDGYEDLTKRKYSYQIDV